MEKKEWRNEKSVGNILERAGGRSARKVEIAKRMGMSKEGGTEMRNDERKKEREVKRLAIKLTRDQRRLTKRTCRVKSNPVSKSQIPLR